jgi:hypothetical protein
LRLIPDRRISRSPGPPVFVEVDFQWQNGGRRPHTLLDTSSSGSIALMSTAPAIWMSNHVGWMGALWALFFAVWNAAALTKKRI